MINFIKDITIRRFWILKLFLNKKQTFLYKSGWIDSFKAKKPVDKNGNPVPWLSISSLMFLDDRLKKSFRILEYGAGNSSLYFAEKCLSVDSIEHDKVWYEIIRKNHSQANSKIYLFSLGDEYVNAINNLRDDYDIILIDGRQRNECTIFSVDYLSSSGVLILDDSERERYLPAIDFLKEKGFKEIKFWGFNLGSVELKATSIFYKENNCLGI